MSRPRKRRICRQLEGETIWKPRSIPMSELEIVELAVDELEAMRLCDLDGLDQVAAGERMGISRGTVQRLLRSGRSRILTALLTDAALHIQRGGDHVDLYPDLG